MPSVETGEEIARNSSGCPEYSDESFTGMLNEKWVWSDEAWFRLERDLHALAGHYAGTDNLPREVAWRVMRIFSWAMEVIGCHLNDHDSYTIKGLSCAELYERRVRMQLMFEGFFKGEMPDSGIFEYRAAEG